MTSREASELHARLLLAFSVDDAKDILGFPPGYDPSPVEVNQAYRNLSKKMHPDVGGDPAKMVELNVAKEILEGRRRPDNMPRINPDREDEARKRKIHTALRTINAERASVMKALEYAERDMDLMASKINLKEWLTGDFADVVGDIHDTIEANQRASKDPDVDKTEALLDKLESRSLRLVRRLNTYMRYQQMFRTPNVSFSDVRIGYERRAEVMEELSNVLELSRQFSSMINTKEVIPVSVTELYHDLHQMFLSFERDWQYRDQRALDELDLRVFKSAGVVRLQLAEVGVDDPEFEDQPKYWYIPGHWDRAMNAVQRRTMNASSMAARVAWRATH